MSVAPRNPELTASAGLEAAQAEINKQTTFTWYTCKVGVNWDSNGFTFLAAKVINFVMNIGAFLIDLFRGAFYLAGMNDGNTSYFSNRTVEKTAPPELEKEEAAIKLLDSNLLSTSQDGEVNPYPLSLDYVLASVEKENIERVGIAPVVNFSELTDEQKIANLSERLNNLREIRKHNKNL